MNKENFESILHTCADLASPIDGALKFLLAHWEYNLYSRSPGPALLEEGVLRPTDLDLACFLSALVDRGAVVNLPSYTSRRATITRSNERVVSKENRHGKCIGLASNQDAFSFSLKIHDANVITSSDEGDSVGAPRNFMLLDVDGKWHDGWRAIEFSPTAKENAFLTDKRLWTGHRVVFENFVHPNRWASFYGRSYLASKLVLQRMTAEAQHLFAESKRLFDTGISPEFQAEHVLDGDRPPPIKTTIGPSKPIKVTAFEAEVHGLVTFGDFPRVADTGQAHADALARRRYLIYTAAPLLRFATRATELAFVVPGDGVPVRRDLPPYWVTSAFKGWERGVVDPGKRTAWTVGDFEGGLKLRHRLYTKTERVAP